MSGLLSRLLQKIRRASKDSVLFAGGLIGVAYETAIEHVDRPSLLALFAGMLGLPAFLNRDKSDDDKKK